jgi:tetratricopeptide (TPR) repeat protein
MTGRSTVEPLHPTPEDFEGFLRDPPGPGHAERNSLIVRHLLAGCSVCGKRLQDLKQAAPTLSRILEIPTSGKAQDSERPASRYSYDWAFARVERTMSTFLARGRLPERLPETLAELAALPESEQLRQVATERFADPDVIRHMLDRSHTIRYENPRKMLHLSLLARTAADACSAEIAGGEEELADLRADAWGQAANALRINGQMIEAEEAFATALQNREKGTGSLELQARLLSQVSSLLCYQRHFTSAVDKAEEAERIYRNLEKMHERGGVLVLKAISILYSGNAESAIEILHQAIPLIDRKEDPRLFLAAHHNLAICYIDLGRPEEALALYCEARDLYRNHSDSLILLRAIWQEGNLLREVGHLHNAEAALLRARQGFLEAGLAYEAAMVSLDLAEVYKKAGLSDKLRRTIAEALPIFRALRVSREVFASLLRLQDAAELGEPAQRASDPST